MIPPSPTLSPFCPSHPASSSVAPHNPTALYSPSSVVPQSSPGLYPSQGPHPSAYKSSQTRQEKFSTFLLLASIRPYFLSLIQPCESIQAFVRKVKLMHWLLSLLEKPSLVKRCWHNAQSVASDSSQPYLLRSLTSSSKLCLHNSRNFGVTPLGLSQCVGSMQ